MEKENINDKKLEAIVKGFGNLLPKNDIKKALDYAIQTHRGPDCLVRLVTSPLPKEIIQDYAVKVFSMPKVKKVSDLEDNLERIEKIKKVEKYLPPGIVREYLANALRYFSNSDEINQIESYEIDVESLSNTFNWLRKLNGKEGTREFKDKLKSMVVYKEKIEELGEESTNNLYRLLEDIKEYHNRPEIYGGEQEIGRLPPKIEKKIRRVIDSIDYCFNQGSIFPKGLSYENITQIDNVFDRFHWSSSCKMENMCRKAKKLSFKKTKLLAGLRGLINKELK
ncbi:MAG: hypothetical protein PHH54_05345 [Candidatus Nanoarchaeia archaeon]|nr:hypothetical protein [Candidatus Nanoarchaeia archaeon]MDD5741383.1 hypothetical protein [Candidatus Nanoarchaeia archaeon]